MFTQRLRMVSIFLVIALVAMLGSTSIPASATVSASHLADSIALPVGFRPEGIAIGKGSAFFVGSLGTFAAEDQPLLGGAIYRGDLITGDGKILIEAQPNQMAVGLQVDRRTNYLFVAGGMFGDVRVYEAASGKLLASYAVGDEGGFINDLVVTKDAVYATDSWLTFLYKVPLADRREADQRGHR